MSFLDTKNTVLVSAGSIGCECERFRHELLDIEYDPDVPSSEAAARLDQIHVPGIAVTSELRELAGRL